MNELERKEYCTIKAEEIANKLKVDASNKIHVRVFFVYLMASI